MLLEARNLCEESKIQHFHSSTTNQLSIPSLHNLKGINNSDWLLDIGATDHVFHSKLFFTRLNCIKPIIARLSNGASITTSFSGSIHFPYNFYLHDVLYIPSFYTNLIFMSKLTSSLNYAFNFTVSHCLIQGTHTLMKIGATRIHHGLYSLISSTIFYINVSSLNTNKNKTYIIF